MDKRERVLDEKEMGKEEDRRAELQKWQTPMLTQLEIKRTMFGSGAYDDGDGGFTTATPT